MIRRLRPALVLGAWLVVSSAARGEGDLLYYVEDGELVITNVRERGDVRPVPWTEPRPVTALRAADLPKTDYDDYINVVAREHGLSPDLVKAVALVESGFNPRAVSPKGAQGLMQLMPATARRYGVKDAFDPLQNLRAGTAHLRDLMDEFQGDVSLALAAYNAGSGAVRRHGGVPAYRETQGYVRKVQHKLGRGERRTRRPPPPGEVRTEVGADGSVTFVNLD